MRFIEYLRRRRQGYTVARSIRYAEEGYRGGDVAVGVVAMLVMAAYLIANLIDILF